MSDFSHPARHPVTTGVSHRSPVVDRWTISLNRTATKKKNTSIRYYSESTASTTTHKNWCMTDGATNQPIVKKKKNLRTVGV